MKCPSCGEITPDAWKQLLERGGSHPIKPRAELQSPGPTDDGSTPTPYQAGRIPMAWVEVDWMVCANSKCGELVMRLHETRPSPMFDYDDPRELDTETHTWGIRPRFGVRRIEPQVGDPYRSDYLEAAALLDISPRMSAVLSRRVLYDLIKRYADIAEYTLKGSIDKFVSNLAYPRHIRENLHLLREMGDFGAHTQTDDQARIVDVTREEAEWTLNVLDRLFDYFIVAPAKDRDLHDVWNEKLEATGRKPLTPLPDDPEVTSK